LDLCVLWLHVGRDLFPFIVLHCVNSIKFVNNKLLH